MISISEKEYGSQVVKDFPRAIYRGSFSHILLFLTPGASQFTWGLLYRGFTALPHSAITNSTKGIMTPPFGTKKFDHAITPSIFYSHVICRHNYNRVLKA